MQLWAQTTYSPSVKKSATVTQGLQWKQHSVSRNGSTISTNEFNLNSNRIRALTCAVAQIVPHTFRMDYPYNSPDECPWSPEYQEESKRKEEARVARLIDEWESDRYYLRHA